MLKAYLLAVTALVNPGGDCTGQPWQVNRAAGQGQKAALSAIRYLAKRDEEIGY